MPDESLGINALIKQLIGKVEEVHADSRETAKEVRVLSNSITKITTQFSGRTSRIEALEVHRDAFTTNLGSPALLVSRLKEVETKASRADNHRLATAAVVTAILGLIGAAAALAKVLTAGG